MVDNQESCPKRGSLNTVRWIGKNEPTFHYGRLTCGDCNRFIKWLKDPGKAFQHISRIAVIDEILATCDDELTRWERTFLQSIKEQKELSPKQKKSLNEIGLKCLHQIICVVE